MPLEAVFETVPGGTLAERVPGPLQPTAARRLQLRAQTTRNKLLDAALTVFAEKGYHAAEVADIVARVPITKGALYHHFGGKEGLFEDACDKLAREIHQAASDAVRPLSGDAWKQLFVSIQSRFDYIASSPEAQRILLIDGPSVLGWQRWRELQADVTLGPLQQTLEILIEQGRIPEQPTGPVAQLLLAALNDAALSVAGAENPKGESVKFYAALSTLINGLRMDISDAEDRASSCRDPRFEHRTQIMIVDELPGNDMGEEQ